jgi:hypothetical protein
LPASRHYHLPSTEDVDNLIVETRKQIARATALLQSCPAPDTFVGRKTQEPFPPEEDLRAKNSVPVPALVGAMEQDSLFRQAPKK